MGLMRALGNVATGYLEARVDQFSDIAKQKADAKALKDKYAAEQAMRIAVQNNELETTAELNELEKEKQIGKRRDYAIALGFTPEFLAYHGDTILASSTNWKDFLNLGKETYGITRWWDTPINFGDSKGGTVQGMLMSSGTGFNKPDAIENTRTNGNIAGSTGELLLDSDKKIQESASKKMLYGKDLFFAKATRARSEGNQYISLDGSQIISGFQYEQNTGKGDFTGPVFTTKIVENDDGTREAQLFTFDKNNFVPLDSTNGQTIFKDTRPFNDSITATSYTVWDDKTEKTYTINGYRSIKTNGEIEEVLTGIDPTLANSWGIDLLTTEFFPPPIAQEKETFHSFNIELNKFKSIMQDKKPGLTINEKTGAGGTGEIAANLLRYQIPKELSTSAKNTIKSQATSLAGFSADKDFITKDTLGQGTIMTFFGDSQSSQTANAFGSIVDSSLGFLDNQYAAYEQSRGTRGLLNQDMGMFSVTSKGITLADELGLSSDDPSKITRDTFVNKVAEYYKEVRETLTENELNRIKSLSKEVRKDEDLSDYDKYLKANNIDVTVKDNSAIASIVVDKILEKDITTLDDLLSTGIGVKEDVKIRKTTAESKRDIADSRAVNKYFPPSEAAMGADFESFVDNYITDPDNEEQLLDLINAVKNLTDDSQEQQSLLKRANQYIETGRKEKYPFPKEETPFQVRKIEREEVGKAEREAVKKELGFDNVPKENGKSDYSQIIKDIGYKPEPSTVRTPAKNKLAPINNLIEKLNTLEVRGDDVITKGMQFRNMSESAIAEHKRVTLIERKDKIQRLKEDIERRLIGLKTDPNAPVVLAKESMPQMTPKEMEELLKQEK